MNDFRIKLADRVVAVSAMHESTRRFCGEYLCGEEPHFSVTTSTEDIAFEREKSIREDALEGHAPREYSDAYLETIAIQRKIAEKLFDYDTLLFHGSVVAVDGEAYLFTAKSGTGKSTHSRLWREMLGDRAVMVNDDKPFLSFVGRALAPAEGVRNDFGGMRAARPAVQVHGSPWNGKHRLGSNVSVPLKAICILERGEENSIRPISAKEALPMLIQQSNRPRSAGKMGKYLELVDKLSGAVNFYALRCNMDPEAARVSYEAMSGDTWRK